LNVFRDVSSLCTAAPVRYKLRAIAHYAALIEADSACEVDLQITPELQTYQPLRKQLVFCIPESPYAHHQN
jgi:hypothetical protein